jgi:hypothetical protein
MTNIGCISRWHQCSLQRLLTDIDSTLERLSTLDITGTGSWARDSGNTVSMVIPECRTRDNAKLQIRDRHIIMSMSQPILTTVGLRDKLSLYHLLSARHALRFPFLFLWGVTCQRSHRSQDIESNHHQHISRLVPIQLFILRHQVFFVSVVF